jgi:transcription antitermination protein NusB
MTNLSAAGPRARRRARTFLVQALYQHQLAGSDAAELTKQFRDYDGFDEADTVYFDELVADVLDGLPALNALISEFASRNPDHMEPVTRAVLWLGLHELGSRHDVPPNVVINEAVEMAKRYGGPDSHRFVNALLDRAAGRLRAGGA